MVSYGVLWCLPHWKGHSGSISSTRQCLTSITHPISLFIRYKALIWNCGKTLQSFQQDGGERFTFSWVQHCTAFFPAMFIFALNVLQPFSDIFTQGWNFSLICASVCSLPSSSFDFFAKVLMHQLWKRFWKSSISGVGVKHMDCLDDSLSLKLLGSKGTIQDIQMESRLKDCHHLLIFEFVYFLSWWSKLDQEWAW